MFDAVRVTIVGKSLCKPLDKIEPLVNLAKKRSPSVGSNLTAIEGHLQSAAGKGLELKLGVRTLCWHWMARCQWG
jgi:hypothetical protein